MYSEEEVEILKERYTAGGTIDEIAVELNKSRRSIIGKLSRLGIYQKKVYKTKTGEDPITKQELVHRISIALGIEVEKLEGLEKSPKGVLQELLNACGGAIGSAP